MAGKFLQTHFETGFQSALEKLGLAQFIAPLMGAVAGPLARGAMGKVAPTLANRIGTGVGSMAFDAVAGQAASSVADRAMNKQPRPPGM